MKIEKQTYPKSRIPLKWQKGSGVQKQKDDLSFLDIISILAITLSLTEKFLYEAIISNLETGKFTQQKPSWALVTVVVLWLNPYKNYLYLATFILVAIWIIKNLYQKWQIWHKKEQTSQK